MRRRINGGSVCAKILFPRTAINTPEAGRRSLKENQVGRCGSLFIQLIQLTLFTISPSTFLVPPGGCRFPGPRRTGYMPRCRLKDNLLKVNEGIRRRREHVS